MGKLKDLTGQRFGRLTVIERAENKGHHTAWLCECDCGTRIITRAQTLQRGRAKSCGCLRRDTSTKHGQWHTHLYKIYYGMKGRCYNPTDSAYHYYGGRGITICDEWLNDFMNFYHWATKNGYSDGLSIDRIDNDKGYSPDNCRWVTQKEQVNNTRWNVYIEYKGSRKTLSAWAEETGLSFDCLYNRLIRRKWSIEEALTIPKGQKRNST